jgi:tetratricopeptide (TPR) repeat protein
MLRSTYPLFALGLAAAALSQPPSAPPQSPASTPPPTAQQSFASLTPEEQQSFQAAGKDFGAGQFAAALPVYQKLLAAHPGDPLLSKMTGESLTDTGSAKQAIALLKPIEQQNPDDWQAAGILARDYAETGDTADRDAEFTRMLALYNRGLTPRGLTQYPAEKIAIGDRQLILFKSFVPWGNFKTYYYGRIMAKDGTQVSAIAIESADFDQTMWAQQHPKEAAAGMRLFSLDGYSIGPPNANGQRSQTHATYGFLDGEPTYDQVRIYFINIASGKPAAPMKGPNTLTFQPPQIPSSAAH